MSLRSIQCIARSSRWTLDCQRFCAATSSTSRMKGTSSQARSILCDTRVCFRFLSQVLTLQTYLDLVRIGFVRTVLVLLGIPRTYSASPCSGRLSSVGLLCCHLCWVSVRALVFLCQFPKSPLPLRLLSFLTLNRFCLVRGKFVVVHSWWSQWCSWWSTAQP